MSNIFETASRKKFRFASAKGDLTAEQLWDLPLLITTPTREIKADLNSVAQTIATELKAAGEGSFVAVSPNPKVGELETKLEVVKHIIGVKQAEIAAAAKRSEKNEERRRLVEALSRKESEEIANMSREEILKRLEAIDN
ncbi:hypothetical protein [Shinella zoogloeoides]|uniref:hypothetical protein n=1 Tax=Shinella zoogloeoides TaxID=352475 RepID=UPI00273D912D|nr:hypothetical protein [Shinella zoogloeoides]WLR90919.1 hypothetical protein Q9316_00650 [Shinella zoogloeoides]